LPKDIEVINMVDFKELRKKLESYEADESEEMEDSEDSSDTMAGFIAPIPGWKNELNDFYIAAPLSIGTGLLMALAFDYVKNKNEEGSQIFEGTWKTMAMVSGSFLFGWGAGKLSRGTVAQAETEFHKKILNKAEEKIKEAEEEKEAEVVKSQEISYNVLTDPTAFQLGPSKASLNTFGDYGSALGQSHLSYSYIG
tara:strand:+ start:4241 stop:4828 length:588 start_codon:yes stop_codon:yes gene_type:complete